MKKTFIAFLLTTAIILKAQIPKIVLDEPYLKSVRKHQLSFNDTSDLYVNDNDGTTLFYYAVVPKNPIKGAVIILPGTWELTEEVINNNKKLIGLAHDRGIITIVPSLNFNLCMDETATQFLDSVFTGVFAKYNVPKTKVIIGGFSLGGMNAIRYTEAAYQNNSNIVKPVAMYGVDPPLDLAVLYHSFKRIIKKNVSETAVGEARSYVERMETQFGGSPEKNPGKYLQYSMYTRSQPEGGNATYLKTLPVRIYSDPDIDWHLKFRNNDLYDMNALDQTAMINDLHQMGNDKAEFINALGKGYRPNGMRHPHSWSIVDPVDCVDWIERCFK